MYKILVRAAHIVLLRPAWLGGWKGGITSCVSDTLLVPGGESGTTWKLT